MAIADVASRLYSSSAYRNTPVIKALADSVKMNLKFRFSLVGMAAALTGSQTLYQIAQQKYLITDEERKQAKEEIHFKKYVVTSISTLSKQVAIIESIVEKNSLMINAIYNDLGYFKGQRKLSGSTSYGNLKSFRAPISSRTVKGRIDVINAEIAALKGIRLSDATTKQKNAAREVELKEKDKTKALVGAAVGATLATIGAALAGGGAISTAALAGIGGIAGAYISSKVVEQAVKTAVPIIGQAFKIGIGLQLAKMTVDYSGRRMSGETGIQTGDENLDRALDPILSPLVDVLNFFLLYMGFKNVNAAMKAIKKGRSGRGALSFLSRIGKGSPTQATAAKAVAPMTGATTGGGLILNPKTGRPFDAPAAATAGRKTKLPKSVLKSLAKLNRWARGPAANLKFAGTALLLVGIANMYSAAEQYESDTISYAQYKERMVDGYKQIIGTIGATGVGAALGSMVGGPVGFVVGALGGFGAGLLMEDPTTSAAIKLFNIFHGIESPETGVMGYSASTSSYASKGTSFKDTDFSQVKANIMMAEGTSQTRDPYNTVYGYGRYGQPSKPLIDMTFGEVADFQKNVLIPNTKGKVPGTNLGTGAVGAYQFNNGTLESLAKQKFGSSWRSEKFTPENQDILAEVLFDERKGNDAKLAATWAYFSNLDEQGGAALRAQRGIGSSGPEAMLAGAGLGSTLDAQLFTLFGKAFANVDTMRTETQAAQDMGARAKIDRVEKTVEAVREKSQAELAAMAAETQKILDMKNLEAINYVDDKAFDEEFAGLYKVA